jgi:hypothetical protein
MNHSCRRFYNFPEDLIRNIYIDIIKIQKEENHKRFLQDIKCGFLKMNSRRVYKELINEINII